MAKTVAAVVKLIDQFSNPSKQVQTASKNIEKRFREMGDNVAAVGGVFTNAGETMTKAISVPLAAAGTAAIKFTSDSQNAFAQYAAATGTATAEMDKYKDAINNVYKENFGESINDVAESMTKVQQNISDLDPKGIEDVTKYAITLSDTLGYDVAESTRAADTMMKNFGISAEESYNLMAQGAQQGLDFSGEMIDSINEYSVQFAKAGMDAEDMFNIMAAGTESGAFNLDKVGDAVKEFSIRAIDGSDTTAEGFKAIGLDAAKMAAEFAKGGDSAKEVFDQTIKGLAAMEDPVAQNIAGVNLFGTQWEDLGAEAVLAMADTTGAIDMTKNAMDEMMETKYDSLSSAMAGLWRTIQVDVLQPIGNMLIPYASKAIDKVKEITKWWNNLAPATQKTIIKFMMVAAVIPPIVLAVGKLTTGIGGAITMFGKVQGAVTRAGGAFKLLTSPVGIAVAAIVAGAILVYKNWDRIAPIVQKIADRFVSFWQTVQPQLQPFIDLCKKIASFMSDVFKVAFDVALPAISDGFVTWFDGISDIIDNLLGVFEGITTFLSGVFTGNWKKAWNGLKDIVGNAFGALEGFVKTPINAVISLVNGAIDGINSIHFTVPDWVPGIGGKGWQGLGIPHIPALAKGTDNWRGGIAQVHERGGEIIDLSRGTRVYPHDESVRMAREESKRNIAITIAKLADQIIVREDADIDRIAEALARKLEQTALNMG